MTVYTLFLYIGIASIALTATLGYGHSKMKEYPVTNPLVWLVQYFVGALLIFSGLVKAVDPMGTAYKMKDYFTEFDAQGFPLMELMQASAVPFSVFMLVLELVLGACLIIGLGRKITTWTTLAMMLFFTFLTGFNYLTGYTSKVDAVGFFEFSKWEAFSDENIRITDCGCFGDFMKLKPIETFVKDIIFTVLSLFLVVNTSKLKELVSGESKIAGFSTRKVLVTILTVISLWFCLQNFFFNIPMVDFRPFAEGINLQTAKMECDANPPKAKSYYLLKNADTGEEKEIDSDEYIKPENKALWTPEKTFVYSNKETGEKQTIKDEANAPDTAIWKLDTMTSRMVWEIQTDKTRREVLDPGCTSQIQYFENFEVLEQQGYQFLVVATDLDKCNKEAFKQIGALAAASEADKIPTRCIYNYISDQSIDEFRQDVQGSYDFATADEKLLKTIVRSNPGLLLIKDGVVVKKWHSSHIPDYAGVKAIMN